MKFLLNHPTVYLSVQALMGAKKARRICVREFAKPREGERVFDIGCGPGFVIDYMPAVSYVGTDVDERSIKYAKQRFGDRGDFHCLELTSDNVQSFGKFDLAMLNGVIHHLDDDSAIELFSIIASCLRPGGRLITLDGCECESMSPISRFLLKHDRGEYVRPLQDYIDLASSSFPKIEAQHRSDMFYVPYDALVMECRLG